MNTEKELSIEEKFVLVCLLAKEHEERINDLESKLSAAEAERDALRKDAGRYRWLRNTQADRYGDEIEFTFNHELEFDELSDPLKALDAAIDAAMGAEG